MTTYGMVSACQLKSREWQYSDFMNIIYCAMYDERRLSCANQFVAVTKYSIEYITE